MNGDNGVIVKRDVRALRY